jgi:hypothetical protein
VARRTDWLEIATKLIVIGVLLYPLVPNAPARWFYASRLLRHLARELGAAALTAEARYYKALEEL